LFTSEHKSFPTAGNDQYGYQALQATWHKFILYSLRSMHCCHSQYFDISRAEYRVLQVPSETPAT